MKLDISNKHVYIIAEIGHNHQGSLEIAFEMFNQAKLAGADAVKLQKRDNKNLYTKSFFNEKYDHENSYGKTYGEHREFLEFDAIQYKELIEYAKEIEIDFFATPFDFTSVEFLEKLNMPAYKIASADLTNTPLQKEIAKTNKQIFLSTGGGSLEDVKRAKENIFSINKNLAILHCTASYPAKVEEMNLSVLSTYSKEFPNITLGLSDHENGIDAGPIAYMLGARVFEKHFTLDRAKKGTDHSFSLEPQGLTKFVRNIHRIKKMLGSSRKQLLESEKKPLFKMKKSIVANNNLIKDQLIKLSDLNFKSPGGGLEPYEAEKLLGKKLKKDISEDDYILFEDLV
jgi:N-acetylneuraminate synthase/sialic acid synthase